MIDRKKSIQAFCDLLNDLSEETEEEPAQRIMLLYLKDGSFLSVTLPKILKKNDPENNVFRLNSGRSKRA